MSKQYHTLLSRPNKQHTWHIEFGDYSRSCVEDERNDMREGADRGTQFKIITTDDQQASIDAAVAKLNGG